MAYRQRLKRLKRKQVTVRGRFVRWGVDLDGNRTMLVRDITDCNGQLLCDHAWMHYNRKRTELNDVKRGTRIQFRARVCPYHRGQLGLRKPTRFKYLG